MTTNQTLSIIIPCYNEVHTIKEVLTSIQTVNIPYNKEIIIVDDGSTDGTRDYLQILPPSIQVILHDQNRGKGAALATGFSHATGDVLVIQDADLEYSPDDYSKLLNPILAGNADVVYGSRFLTDQPHRVLYFWHELANRFLTFLSNFFTNLNLTDMETCYKMFTRPIYTQLSLTETGFGVEPEITAKVAKLKCRVFEVGIYYNGRTYEEGKKITWKDGLWAIWCIIRYNVLPT